VAAIAQLARVNLEDPALSALRVEVARDALRKRDEQWYLLEDPLASGEAARSVAASASMMVILKLIEVPPWLERRRSLLSEMAESESQRAGSPGCAGGPAHAEPLAMLASLGTLWKLAFRNSLVGDVVRIRIAIVSQR